MLKSHSLTTVQRKVNLINILQLKSPITNTANFLLAVKENHYLQLKLF